MEESYFRGAAWLRRLKLSITLVTIPIGLHTLASAIWPADPMGVLVVDRYGRTIEHRVICAGGQVMSSDADGFTPECLRDFDGPAHLPVVLDALGNRQYPVTDVTPANGVLRVVVVKSHVGARYFEAGRP